MDIFDEDIALEQINPGLYSGNLSGNWLVNGNPFGGMLLALVTNAMLLNTRRETTPIVTASFITRSDVGPVDLSVQTIHRSKQFDRLEARLSQGGTERAIAHGTFKEPSVECPVSRYEGGPPDVRPPGECVRIELTPGYTLFEHEDVLLDPACAGWLEGRPSDISEMRGWFSFSSGRPYDVPSVVFAADAFPPAVLASQGMLAWVPTIEMMVNVRHVPQSGLLKCRFKTRFIDCGLVEEDGDLWDEEGNLVALSRQIAQFRVPRTPS